ncbi:MAG: HipA domain-containing protein [Lachnospiraceae bacterium]|nr:HipA domain-containing protein [Lachnospiraceae bacterium]
MDRLIVSIERDGKQVRVGTIEGKEDYGGFVYDEAYLASRDAAPISISLPLQEERFSGQRTRTFFEGLLPEGFTRRTVAHRMRADENDFMTLLRGLGKECLGALRVIAEGEMVEENTYEPLSEDRVKELASEGVVKSSEFVLKAHLSLTGASGKVGLYYDEPDDVWYLPKGTAASTHIVKQSHVRLDGIVANEQLSLLAARKIGIEVPDSFIIRTGGTRDDEVLFATKRYDRCFTRGYHTPEGLPIPMRLHQEDFAQALGIASKDKYEHPGDRHLQKIFTMLRSVSANPIEDSLKLWDIIVYDFLVGNSDNHIKNISILYSRDLKTLRLAPAYDILSTSIYEESSRNMAFSLGGRYALDDITEEAFGDAAEEAGFSRKVGLRHLKQLSGKFEKALDEAASELEAQGFSQAAGLKDKILKTGGYGVLAGRKA